MEIQFIGENIFAANLGYFFVSLSFGAAFLAFVAYLFAGIQGDSGWKKIGRIGFMTHSVGVFGIIAVMAHLLISHSYEFYYIWSHSSNTLPAAYMLACFWEGQEGSFLLWTFWHVILGWFLLKTSKQWESGVMMVVSMAQILLSAMLLGLNLWGDEAADLGMNPFRFLRTEMDAPIFSDPHYLDKIVDGTGLNPLLQNYWNVIHPPVLFLGFALTIVPFAYVVAGLMKAEYKTWIRPALIWTSITVGVLGLGILMGGAWAYEALSFGGFWAWDPVENAVLVPWIIVVAGLHTLVIYKNTGKALLSTIVLLGFGFLLILYSTFLTRSGILGDTSVHSFTDLGLSGQLLVFLLAFVFLFLGIIIYRFKSIPKSKSEDEMTSRELWMLIGSLVLIVSAFQIIFSTSIPVINAVMNLFAKLFGQAQDFNMAPPTEAVAHYNQFQIPFAILVALLTALGQYFKYKKSPKTVWKKILIGVGIAIPFTILFSLGTELYSPLYIGLLFASVFTITANVEMLRPHLKPTKFRFSGASIAHIGLGLIFMGSLISNGKRQIVSRNNAGIDYGEDYTEEEKVDNVLLPRGKAIPMGGYLITYHEDSVAEPNHYYKVEYKQIDNETGEKLERFFLYPKAQINPNMGLVSDPSIRRTFSSDLYTHVTSVPREEDKEEFSKAENFQVMIGDTLKYRDMSIIIKMIDLAPELPEGLDPAQDSIYATTLKLEVTKEEQTIELNPYFIIQGNQLLRPAAQNDDIGLRAFFVNINRDTKDFEIALSVKNSDSPEYIIMKAMVFPMINLLWTGCILLFFGSLIAAYRRWKEKALAV